ncbi:MAG: 4-alpha-glucanotransferase [Rectinema sp.]
MNISRSSGVLLHPLSLGGPWPCGTMGDEARLFVDFCTQARLGWWQILPLGPTAFGDSPYQSPSAFAGNPYLIDPQALAAQGLLSREELESYRCTRGKESVPSLTRSKHSERNSQDRLSLARPEVGDNTLPSLSNHQEYVDYTSLFATNAKLMEAAWSHFRANSVDQEQSTFDQFCKSNISWLDDYALFTAIKEKEQYRPWYEWPQKLKSREHSALEEFEKSNKELICRIKFTQFLFFEQWLALKQYANSKGLKLIGDIPIFAAWDSADVWAHRELFQLDEKGRPIRVAGVPPDYFTATGQLWGNPLYDWQAHEQEGYAWWIARVQHSLKLVDALRIDHFRGFEAYWAVPFGEPTAKNGYWEKGPGHRLFDALNRELGELPIIAEDLGFITPEVIELRDSLGFPGMRILQFAFELEEDNQDYPHNYLKHCIAYTGTHDNDTAMGWLSHAPLAAKKRALSYMHAKPSTFYQDIVRTAWASPAMLAIAPMQDFLGLGTEARMNFPGTTSGWWRWRMNNESLKPVLAHRIRRLSETYFRASTAG